MQSRDIYPLNPTVIPESVFEPSKNTTTQAAPTLPASHPAMLEVVDELDAPVARIDTQSRGSPIDLLNPFDGASARDTPVSPAHGGHNAPSRDNTDTSRFGAPTLHEDSAFDAQKPHKPTRSFSALLVHPPASLSLPRPAYRIAGQTSMPSPAATREE
jgi:hypothetical protein